MMTVISAAWYIPMPYVKASGEDNQTILDGFACGFTHKGSISTAGLTSIAG